MPVFRGTIYLPGRNASRTNYARNAGPRTGSSLAAIMAGIAARERINIVMRLKSGRLTGFWQAGREDALSMRRLRCSSASPGGAAVRHPWCTVANMYLNPAGKRNE
jgi:hypothetical protein